MPDPIPLSRRYRLSELVKHAQHVLQEQGDMDVAIYQTKGNLTVKHAMVTTSPCFDGHGPVQHLSPVHPQGLTYLLLP